MYRKIETAMQSSPTKTLPAGMTHLSGRKTNIEGTLKKWSRASGGFLNAKRMEKAP